MDGRHPGLADVARSALVVVDVQEKLLPAIHEHERVVRETVRLLEGAALLRVPTLVSEQYPAGLGPTVAAVRAAAGAAPVVVKTSFSCADEPKFLEALRRLDRDQIVLVGIETHVCVLQTAADLVARGFRVIVAADAVSSRTAENRETALARLARFGVDVSSVEATLFEWTRRSGTELFKAVSRLVR
jgi:nicotinamidase-related amidase